MADSLGKINPFRYRGYVYDEETGLYYLRSRYYHSAWGRFINADSIVDNNLYQYCNCTPIIYGDSDGFAPDYLGEIHAQVQERICIMASELEDVFIDKEIRVNFVPPVEYNRHVGHTYGYVDLYNPATGEMWEIKPKNWRERKAIRQLADYVHGTIQGVYSQNKQPSTIGGDYTYLTGQFVYESKSLKTYDVRYWYAGSGIIKYDYEERKYKGETKVSASEIAGSILMALLSAMLWALTQGRGPIPAF